MRIERTLTFLMAAVWLVLAGTAMADITVASSASQENVLRIGIGPGENGQTWYFDSNWMQNLFDNPGFEPATQGWVWIVGSTHTSSSLSTTNDDGAASGYWVGAQCSVRSSSIPASVGAVFSPTSFSSGGTFGGTFPTLNTGDTFGCNQTTMASFGGLFSASSNWRSSDGAVAGSTAFPYEGQGALAFSFSSGTSHSANAYWDTDTPIGGVCSNDNVTNCTAANEATDCGSGNTCLVAPLEPWHEIVGPFEIAFYAAAINASNPQVTVSLVRPGGVNVSHTFTLANDGAYHRYEYDFTGTDTAASAKSTLKFTMNSTVGAAATGEVIYVDDAYLGRQEASATGFRDEMKTVMSTMRVGSLRYMIENTLDVDDAHFEGPAGCTPGAVNVSGYVKGGCDYLKGSSGTSNGLQGWSYSPQDIYALSAAVDAVPWVSIPNTFSDADLQQFIDNACTAFSQYGFSQIWIEQSNEDWNGFGFGAILVNAGTGSYTYYGEIAGRNFNVMSTEAASKCPAFAAQFHYVIGNQICNSGVLAKALAGAQQAGFPIPNTSQYGSDDAPYNPPGGSIPSESGTLAEQAAAYAAYLFDAIPSQAACFSYDKTAGGLGSNNTMAAYETGLNGANSSGGSTSEQAYLAEGDLASGTAQAANWMESMQNGAVLQEEFDLGFMEQGSIHAPIYGCAHDMDSDFGPTFPHLRPRCLALELVNSAIGGNYYATFGNPTGVYTNAFENNGTWSAVLVNTNGTPQSVTVDFPGGTVPNQATTLNYVNGITDNTENSNDVTVGPLAGGVSCTGQNCSVTLPPWNVVALSNSGSQATPTPTATAPATPKPSATATPTATSSPPPTSTPKATPVSGDMPACTPVLTSPAPGAQVSGQIAVRVVPNCNSAAVACGYFVRQWLPNGAASDSLGSTYTLDTTQFPNGNTGLYAQIYNAGCGSFAGQNVFGNANVSITIAN